MICQELKILLKKPARRWDEAFPVGNGSLGGMVFGGTDKERIALNEDTLWSGYPNPHRNAEAAEHLSSVRRKLASGLIPEAEKELSEHMLGVYSQSYLPLGDLTIETETQQEATEYSRWLDLDSALAVTEWKSGGDAYRREVFVSHPAQAMDIRMKTTAERGMDLRIGLISQLRHRVYTKEGRLVLLVEAPEHADPGYASGNEPLVYGEPNRGMGAAATVAVTCEGGRVVMAGGSILVNRASSVRIILTSATGFKAYNQMPETDPLKVLETAEARMKNALKLSAEAMVNAHQEDHQTFFRRVCLELPQVDNVGGLPVDARLEGLRLTGRDPGLHSLYFQFGRYMKIASSRQGTQASNLQGIWNDMVQPPWSSNYTVNINVEMNYWLAENCNLSELHAPLFDLIDGLAETGAVTAKEQHGARGFVCHHNTDIWRASTPVGGNPQWAWWPVGAAWLVTHLWEHYLFTGDTAFLQARALPRMQQSALLLLDFLVPVASGHLAVSPSTSPENVFLLDGKPCAVQTGSTMDMELCRAVFGAVIEAEEILGIENGLKRQLKETMPRLLPRKTGAGGRLLEWSEEYTECEPGHRHVSHLFGVYPGAALTPGRETEFFNAARASLEHRLASGGGHTGWSAAWITNLWARFGDAHRAGEWITHLLTHSTNCNLFDMHPPFQIDGNFGGSAAIAEMLVQSHEGFIRLLPALPPEWDEGRVTGIRARGGWTADISWKDGELTQAFLTGPEGTGTEVRYKHRALTISGQSSPIRIDLSDFC